MTTTTTTPPVSSRIAWPATIWIGAFHVLALLAFVPAFFSWQALAVCVFMHWVFGGLGIPELFMALIRVHFSAQLRLSRGSELQCCLGISAHHSPP